MYLPITIVSSLFCGCIFFTSTSVRSLLHVHDFIVVVVVLLHSTVSPIPCKHIGWQALYNQLDSAVGKSFPSIAAFALAPFISF